MTPSEIQQAFLLALVRFPQVITSTGADGAEFFVLVGPDDSPTEVESHSITLLAEKHRRVYGVSCPCHNKLACVFVPDERGRHWAVSALAGGVGVWAPNGERPLATYAGTVIEFLGGTAGRVH